MSKIKLIVFDWDDVFTLGSSEGYYSSYQKAVESVGINPDVVKTQAKQKFIHVA